LTLCPIKEEATQKSIEMAAEQAFMGTPWRVKKSREKG
jgi:hypothetical protein